MTSVHPPTLSLRTESFFPFSFRVIATGILLILVGNGSRMIVAEANVRRGDVEFESSDGGVSITSDFPGGRMNRCRQHATLCR